ncbi:tripartite motif-containing protein 3-like [Branchiostoma floridae]|uniref:Tripartite motif-containing protein 3-like n=1 Tax=Branchiostoma floridae TaxID=7739 RepID=A0A9J7K708_BRAFL|nr:tripartite motif-containing protein 3-like [Branchiostoma floridae]
MQDSRIVANLCERLKKQETLPGEVKEEHQSTNKCILHSSKELKLYCKQCQMPVCELCLEEKHDNHRTTTVNVAAQERSSTDQALINEGRNILNSYCSFIRDLRETEKTLDEQKQQRDNSIIQAYNQMVKTMVQQLKQSKDYLLSESQQNHSENLERIQNGRGIVLADVNELSTACDQAEQKMKQGVVEFLSQQTALTEVVEKYRGKAVLTPVQTQPAVFHPTDTTLAVLGHMTVHPLPSAPIPAAPAVREKSHRHGNQELQSLTSALIPAAPVARGKGHHQGNQEIKSLPSAPMPFASTTTNDSSQVTGHHHGNQRQWEDQPLMFGGEGSGTGYFSNPTGVTVSERGQIFVADRENQRIQVFILQGTFVRKFTTRVFPDSEDSCYCFTSSLSDGQKMRPYDVAMDGKGKLWVLGILDVHTEFAVQYNKHGEVLRSFELKSTGWAKRVAVDARRNHILITQTTGDRDNRQGEVLVFRPDGTLVRTMGGDSKTDFFNMGQPQGMKFPQYLTVDGEGNILVTDCDSHCVVVYNEHGQFLFQFGSKGSGEGQLDYPLGICTDRAGNIIVADYGNNRVEMFDKTADKTIKRFNDMR